ncbi:MAG: RecQ family ATP-dependent DNA helicase [Chitinophagaceae bacterium]|nr:RecQ family ATP-dependent DNA helicase [Chitinophagaceae bacterium]
MQEDIICAVLDGNDTLAIMPTGGGKSICFQVPALAKPGICLVVTPLIALMKDQVEKLNQKGILALAIHSGMSFTEVRKTLGTAVHGNYKFLYVSPERLTTRLFKEYLPALPLNLIAVDEAHCISQWGYDFRPAYLSIAEIRAEKKNVPVLALTASATKLVQEDICDKLQFRNTRFFQQSYERPNLSYSVLEVDVKINKLIDIIQKVPGCGIVYCRSRKRTKEMAELLQLHHISVDYYHAGLTHEERNEKQEKWLRNKTRIMVCTNAFGMGIDKPDVRLVVHVDIPECIESYYQEAGRAGRDGKKSYAVLLFRPPDIEELKKIPEIKFPGLPEIKHVYQSLVNYFQLPAGSGEDMFFDFDMDEFTKAFKLSPLLVTYAIRAMEQENILTYNDQFFQPSTVMFVCSKEKIEQAEKENAAAEPCIKFLLRSYGGILDVPVPVNEKHIAKKLRKEIKEIQAMLLQLHRMGIIQYQQQKEDPQIRFLGPRVITDNLTINITNYAARKKVTEDQVAAMTGYVENRKDCRSKIIAGYFNDHTIPRCGICDNCLQRKKETISADEFNLLQEDIISALSRQPLTMKELFTLLPRIKQQKIWSMIQHLLEENLVELGEDIRFGKLHIKKKGQDKNPARF